MDEREQFEAWYSKQGFGERDAWNAWQARAALDSKDEEFCTAYAEEWKDTLKEQSDRIKELESALASAPAQPGDALYTMDQMRDYAQSFHRSRTEHLRPRWVSVGDRLPEREQMVLVFRPDAHHRPACDPNIDVREYLGNGKFRSSHEVTHWMPLAAAPASVASKEVPTS